MARREAKGRWAWSAAAMALCAMLGASIAAVQTGVAARPGTRSAQPAEPRAGAAPREEPAAPPGAPAQRDLVVIDPGHGGSNTGAPTLREGLFEKHVTLALAVRLADRLRARGIAASLTRERDEYLSLRQRVAIANRCGAALFLSLHGNATESHSQRGFETYILTPRALDIDGRALRAGEGHPRPGVAPATALLLDDVERGLAQDGAVALAAAVQAELAALRGAEGDRGVRQASMDVLLGATMPAVLVEVGFLDHPVEGRELLDPAVLDRLAGALAEAVASQLARE